MRLEIALAIIISSVSPYLCTVDVQRPELMAQLTKRLLQAIAKPGRLTTMTCWTSGKWNRISISFFIIMKFLIPSEFSLKFYKTFHMTFENYESNDYELAMSSINYNNLPHSNQSHYEFIMIDRNCDYSMDVLKFVGKGIDDYSWIIWSFPSNQVIKLSFGINFASR